MVKLTQEQLDAIPESGLFSFKKEGNITIPVPVKMGACNMPVYFTDNEGTVWRFGLRMDDNTIVKIRVD